MLDSKSELLGWLLYNGLSVQNNLFEGEFLKVFWISYFGKGSLFLMIEVGWMETVPSLRTRLFYQFRFSAQMDLLLLGIDSWCFER